MAVRALSCSEPAGRPARIPVGVFGLGPVGLAAVRAVAQTDELELVAVVDTDPRLVGRPLCDLAVVETNALTVSSEKGALEHLRGGVVVQATGSRLLEVAPQIHAAIAAGSSVVSACPELAFPWLAHPETAAELDRAAARAGVSVLGAGVNPGFALDRLVASAAAASGNVRRVRALRSVNIANRRPALLRKAGVGLSPAAFRSAAATGDVGHVGLVESAALIASALQLGCDRFEEALAPVAAARAWDAPVGVAVGQVSGYTQTAIGRRRENVLIEIELTYALGVPDLDEITIDAEPAVRLCLQGGISGDLATAWSMVNAAARLPGAKPGLLTVIDLPPRSVRRRREET